MMRKANPMGKDMKGVIDEDDAQQHAEAARAVWGSYGAFLEARKTIELDDNLMKAIDTAIGFGKALAFIYEPMVEEEELEDD